MAAPTTNLDRTQTVTLANPTPPTNSVVTYQGTPPTPQGLEPADIEPPDIVIPWITADPLNGAAAPELSGLAEADGTAQMAVVPSGRVTGHSVLDDYTESPNSDHPSGSSSSLPAWVPANAVIHIDLVGGDPQGRAWVAGTGEVAVDTLLGSDPVFVLPTGYYPGNLTPDGYVIGVDELDENVPPPAFIGAAKTLLLAGSTIRLQSTWVDTEFGFEAKISFDSVDIETEVRIVLNGQNNVLKTTSNAEGADLFYELFGVYNSGIRSLNCFVATLANPRIEVAANGSSAVALTMTEVDYPVSGGQMIVGTTLGANNTTAIQSITLYDPLPSTAGLSDLSEVTG